MPRLTEQESVAYLKEVYQMRESMYRRKLEADLEQTGEELDNCKDDIQTRWLQGKRQYIRQQLAEFATVKEQLHKVAAVSVATINRAF